MCRLFDRADPSKKEEQSESLDLSRLKKGAQKEAFRWISIIIREKHGSRNYFLDSCLSGDLRQISNFETWFRVLKLRFMFGNLVSYF